MILFLIVHINNLKAIAAFIEDIIFILIFYLIFIIIFYIDKIKLILIIVRLGNFIWCFITTIITFIFIIDWLVYLFAYGITISLSNLPCNE